MSKGTYGVSMHLWRPKHKNWKKVKKRNKIIAYLKSGHSVKQTAHIFGITESKIWGIISHY